MRLNLDVASPRIEERKPNFPIFSFYIMVHTLHITVFSLTSLADYEWFYRWRRSVTVSVWVYLYYTRHFWGEGYIRKHINRYLLSLYIGLFFGTEHIYLHKFLYVYVSKTYMTYLCVCIYTYWPYIQTTQKSPTYMSMCVNIYACVYIYKWG